MAAQSRAAGAKQTGPMPPSSPQAAEEEGDERRNAAAEMGPVFRRNHEVQIWLTCRAARLHVVACRKVGGSEKPLVGQSTLNVFIFAQRWIIVQRNRQRSGRDFVHMWHTRAN